MALRTVHKMAMIESMSHVLLQSEINHRLKSLTVSKLLKIHSVQVCVFTGGYTAWIHYSMEVVD